MITFTFLINKDEIALGLDFVYLLPLECKKYSQFSEKSCRKIKTKIPYCSNLTNK
jgi:hypothetical protein